METKFNKDQALSDIIQDFNKLERLLDQIITKNKDFIQESKRSPNKFIDKVKLIKNDLNLIKDEDYFIFKKLGQIRNAFAHQTSKDMHPSVKLPLILPISFKYHLDVKIEKNKVECSSMEELYIEFQEKYDNAIRILDLLK